MSQRTSLPSGCPYPPRQASSVLFTLSYWGCPMYCPVSSLDVFHTCCSFSLEHPCPHLPAYFCIPHSPPHSPPLSTFSELPPTPVLLESSMSSGVLTELSYPTEASWGCMEPVSHVSSLLQFSSSQRCHSSLHP